MTCRDAIDVLAEFLDQTLSHEAGEALEAHFRDCPPCQAYLSTYRATRGLVGGGGQDRDAPRGPRPPPPVPDRPTRRLIIAGSVEAPGGPPASADYSRTRTR